MTCVVGKSKFSVNSELACELELHSHGSIVDIEPVTWNSTFVSKCDRTTSVNLETCAMGVTWQPNTSYRLVLNAGITTELNGDPSPEQVIEFTTNDIPSIISSVPAKNDISAAPFSSIVLNFDRYININTTIGGTLYDRNIKVFEKHGALIKTFYHGNVSFSDKHNSVILDVSDQIINESTTFEVEIGPDMFYDNDNFYSEMVTGSNLSFSTRITGYLVSNSSVYASSKVNYSVRPALSSVSSLLSNPVKVLSYMIPRTFIANQSNAIFSTNTPQIDFYNPGSTTFEVRLSSANGKFALNSSSSPSSLLVISGTLSQVNNSIAGVLFYPTKSYTSNTSITFAVYANSTLLITSTKAANYASTSTVSTDYVFTTSSTWVPTYEEIEYCSASVLVVGGGGGAAAGGGGGGGVGILTNQSISNTTYTVTVGTGGAPAAYIGSGIETYSVIQGSSGTSSSAFGVTANGGGGGYYRNAGAYFLRGGNSGSVTGLVTLATNTGGAGYSTTAGGGGAGSGGAGVAATSTKAGNGGAGLSGVGGGGGGTWPGGGGTSGAGTDGGGYDQMNAPRTKPVANSGGGGGAGWSSTSTFHATAGADGKVKITTIR